MKTTSVVPALIVAATLILTASLRAEEAPPAPSSAAKPGPRHEEILKRFDKNGDGKLDEDEKAAAKAYHREHGGRREKFREQAMEKFDKNGDGKLDAAEKAEMRNAMETNPRVLKRFDKDRDGKLNAAEKSAAREAARELRGNKNTDATNK
jgi:hypothetical protein